MAVRPVSLGLMSFPSSTLAYTTQWSPVSIRSATRHSRYDRAIGMTTHSVLGESVTSMPSKRSSPGANCLPSCLNTSFVRPSASTLRLKALPLSSRLSTARSFLTAMVTPGGSKDAWDTQEAIMALEASPSLVVSTQREPRMRPIATAVASSSFTTGRTRLVRLVMRLRVIFLTASARSTPLSSQICIICSSGVNLQRMGSKAMPKPAFLRRSSISSTASPLHPNDPKTPHGSPRASLLERMVPSALCTGVGMCPPRVGEPTTKPAERFTSKLISSEVENSQLHASTPTPALERPRAMPSAMAVVLP
mmetsp:Transcript_65597/g.207482  ORF Transcript_65597/g.207482 Transcript_65597/m.207482 type:complete len:307 (+) Transcript_65597:163-1083(+)